MFYSGQILSFHLPCLYHLYSPIIRGSQEHERSQSSNSGNDNANDHVQLKRQNVPHRRERFKKMIKKKKNEGARLTVTEKFATNKLPKVVFIYLFNYYFVVGCDNREEKG